jgi:hypothetical protein
MENNTQGNAGASDAKSKDLERGLLLVDWGAVWMAWLIAGTVYLVLELWIVPEVMGGNFWISVRLVASILLGSEVLAPPDTFNGPALFAAIVTIYGVSLLATVVIALIIHRGGLILGIVGGAILGLSFHAINYYSLTAFFPQFFALNAPAVAVAHAIFGALAGGLYEWLEADELEVAQGELGSL